MRVRASHLAGVLSVLALTGGVAPPPTVTFNDNTSVAGRMVGGEWVVDLEVRPASWYPLGPESAPVEVLAFAERGKDPVNPGPMIRVSVGTRVRVSLTNHSDTTLIVRGLADRQVEVMDTVVVEPGETRYVRFTTDAPGTYYYWAGRPSTRANPLTRDNRDAQLNGALVVDAPGVTERRHERVFVVSEWVERTQGGGIRDQLFMFNGRPWPLTERLTYTMGDSIHWRFINSTADIHPFHLHGFYYRVESRGDMQRDSLYWPDQRRMAVTETMRTGETMAITWSPDRPGGWLFHCHFPLHVTPNLRPGADALPPPERLAEVRKGHPDHDPHNHVENGMGGLMLRMYVRPAPGWAPDTRPRRNLRLLVQHDSTPPDSVARFGYVLQEGSAVPAPDSVNVPGSTIVLRRGEPVTIWVINRTPEPTAVHWHGMELESPSDGVVGVGGYEDAPSPAIMPGDSFPAYMTPPRSGSFMYHTHVNDLRQLLAGLWGPLLVVEPDAWDRAHDLVFMLGQNMSNRPTVNGHDGTAEPLTLTAGERYHLRFMNIAINRPGVYWQLASLDDRFRAPGWRLLARDGHDVPEWQRTLRESRASLSIGETVDFELVAPARGGVAVELRTGAGVLLFRQELRVGR